MSDTPDAPPLPAPLPAATPADARPAAAGASRVSPEGPASPPPQAAADGVPSAPPALPGRWLAAGAMVLASLTTAALVFAWNGQQRLKAVEAELVRRQSDSALQAAEAAAVARQAQQVAQDAAAKIGLLEARVSETSVQRSQLEELIQSMARSRDENVLADVDAALRVAMQQSAITGSADPLVSALRQADERLGRYNQPRLERVRRAVLKDLERTRAAGVADISMLTLRLDEVMRVVDELPLLATAERRPAGRAAAAGAASVAGSASAAASAMAGPGGTSALARRWQTLVDHVGVELRSLVRVTRIDQPEAALVAPEQAFFLRENLKLRLLKARLALLSRQFDIAQSDLRDAQSALDRYFDRGSRRVAGASEGVRQVMTQARQVAVPRPDATLAAIATTAAGR